MELCVSSYSFGHYISDELLGVKGVMDKSKEMGFKGIEMVESDYVNLDLEFAGKIKEYSEKISLPVVGFDVRADFIENGKGCQEKEIERVCGLIDLAAAMGSPRIRFDVWHGDCPENPNATFEEILPDVVKCVRRVADYAETKGIMTLTENHGYHVQHSDRVVKLIKAVDRKNYKALVDIGNFLCVDENNISAIENVADIAVHAHIKDFHRKPKDGPNPGDGWFPSSNGTFLRGAIVGHGALDIPASLRALKKHGYNGCLVLEFEGLEDNLTGIKIGKDNAERFLSECEA